jgi:uncharacterized FlaG/YvyC family protein
METTSVTAAIAPVPSVPSRPAQTVSVGRDASTGLVVVRYVDPETGRTVLQVPAEEVLRSISALATGMHQKMEGK